MLRPQAEQLIDRAQAGERLTSTDRRHCIAYLMATAPDMSKRAMADLFGCNESLIRQDFKKIREEKAKLIKEDDISLVIADITLTFEKQVMDVESSKNACKKGTMAYLNHCRAIARMQMERVELLQNLGWYPKNLGNMTMEKFEYHAIVTKDGSVDTRPVNLAQNAIDVEIVEEPLALPAPDVVDEFEQEKDA